MYKTLWLDFDDDVLCPDEPTLAQRYRNKNALVRGAMAVGEKEAYNIIAYFSLREGVLPPLEVDVAVKVLKHIKSIEKPVDIG